MTRHFCSYSDSAYLPRLKALYASMVRHCGDFRLHVLAWDYGVRDWCRREDIDCQRIDEDFLDRYPALAIDKLPGPPRSRVEHMWTCGPQWIVDVMDKTGEPVAYVDADVMFHSFPEPVFAEIGDAPVGVVPHGFCEAAPAPIPTIKSHSIFGKYNVGLIHFNDPRVALNWATNCRTWCYAHLEHWPDASCDPLVLYGDQKYLDAWPERFNGHVVRYPGACAGPWGVHARPLEVRDGKIHFGGEPLVAWHYSGYRELPDGHTVMTRPEYMLTNEQAEILYTPYIKALEEAKR